MKICIVNHKIKKGDGQGRVNYEIVKASANQGHKITLIASEVAPEIRDYPGLEFIYIPVKFLPTELLRNFFFAQISTIWLYHNRKKFDVIQVNGAITNAKADVNAVHFVHSSWLKSPAHIFRTRCNLYSAYQWVYTAVNSILEQQSFQKARLIVAVSEKVKQELVKLSIPVKKIRTITNGVDLQEFTPGKTTRTQLGLPVNVTLALFAGDIRTSRKNLDTILYALLQVPNIHLAVVGDVETSPFPGLATSLGLEKRVHFLGYRQDMAAIMRSADIFVFPSRYEACTLVLLEAMASGLPVITADTTGGAELVTPESGIVLQDCNNVQSLSLAISFLVNHPSQMKSMGKIARIVAEEHSWKNMSQAYLNLFEELSHQ